MVEYKHQDALRTIGEVAGDIGVATHVLRFWESKFPQIKPQKRRGRRYYDADSIAVIKTIKTLLYDQGYTIKGVHKFLIHAKKAQSKNFNSAATLDSPIPEDKFRHDTLGNIVADNQSATDAPEFNNDEMGKLHQIYNGLLKARKKLTSSN